MTRDPAGFLDPLAPKTVGGWYYNMHFYTRTWEPYVEYAWRPAAQSHDHARREIHARAARDRGADQPDHDLLPAFFSHRLHANACRS
jgi:hypothetical protein